MLYPVKIKVQTAKAIGIVNDIMFNVLNIVCAAVISGLRYVENNASVSNAQAVQTVIAQEDMQITKSGLRFLMVSAEKNLTLWCTTGVVEKVKSKIEITSLEAKFQKIPQHIPSKPHYKSFTRIIVNANCIMLATRVATVGTSNL
jgi:hypothetical protein